MNVLKSVLRICVITLIIFELWACKSPNVQEYFADYNAKKKHTEFVGSVHRISILHLDSLTSLLMASIIDPQTQLTDSVWNSLAKEHPNIGKGKYFTLKLELIDSTSPGILPGQKPDVEFNPSGLGPDFKTQIMYYLEGMRAHIWFECGKFEYPLDFYQFERTWGMVPYRNIQIGSANATSDCFLVLADPLPGMGHHKILVKDLE